MTAPINTFRWVISHAQSSNPDWGPDLIAVRIDEKTVSLLRDFLGGLHKMVVTGSAMTRLQWMGAHIEFLREPEIENSEADLLADLDEDTAILLAGMELPRPCLYDREFRAECDSFTMLRVSERFEPEVYAAARIKHTPVEVESKIDLWPLIDKAFPAPKSKPEHHYNVIVRGCAASGMED